MKFPVERICNKLSHQNVLRILRIEAIFLEKHPGESKRIGIRNYRQRGDLKSIERSRGLKNPTAAA